ncbi:hypothetical protein G6M89_02065 [Natronolimnobius sp. AArcel1]|uniref:hypothetical protein n=1 Tax=Natronolimnobius sp. AArcel1 TaxID=1679093 RepID=UPI0013EC0E15|nr:hypothetical protein [Natronolimnobius sp. AArcel1]NGM67805.1 hypothetical protein [Natronolimnobius sp. AArcel1]
MTIEFEQTTSPVGLEICDSIEQRRLKLQADGPFSVTTVDADGFCFPVDRACRFTVSELVFNQSYSMSIHDSTGQTEATVEVGGTAQLEGRTQFVGLSGPIRVYCRVDTAATLDHGLSSVRLTFDEPATVTLGARSPHDRPAGTITTPGDPDSLMQAISTLPSALKTTSPERTWPTLRGHPPLIELGDALEIPDAIEDPDSDIELIVPATHAAIYQAAPLAFFLGATLRPGSEPTLETPRGSYPLTEDRSLEDAVARLLKRSFLLDCLSRTDGLFQYEFHERTALADRLPFDLAETYAAPLPDRLERYLEVPYDLLEPYVPRWPLTAHLPAEPAAAEIIPFIVNELGIVRIARGQRLESAPAQHTESTPDAQVVRSASSSRTNAPDSLDTGPSTIVPHVTDEAVEHAWFGDGVPQNASKATVEAYRNQLTRDERTESIEILLVCNDARMLAEHDLLDETYGNREALPFEIDSAFGVDTDQFASLLEDGGYDFLHYIGHATADGLRCPDGDLDVRALESVDLGVFFLNACCSYEQGLALTRRGAFGGVSTCADVPNEEAVDAGETMARLLNRGFPLRGALEIAREHSRLGEQYLIVGDGSTDIAQSDGGAPMVIELERTADSCQFGATSYSTKEFKLGTTTASTLEVADDRHLTPSTTPRSAVDSQALQEYLTWTKFPVLYDDELHWNDGIGPGIDL